MRKGFVAASRPAVVSDGSLMWSRQFGAEGPVYDGGDAVAATVDGGAVVVGSVSGSLDGADFRGMRDAFVRRYDAAGEADWTTYGVLHPNPGVEPGSSDVYVRTYGP